LYSSHAKRHFFISQNLSIAEFWVVKPISVVTVVSEELIASIFRVSSIVDMEAMRCMTARRHKPETTIDIFTAVKT
jgi:hypothetical protein